ncbi:recombinase family protein [Paracoccus sp. SSJ]|uniref:recombinase family protein n=1 Tax=Paracoccus sp. SSJ TaxID=3050636 RepID=UPI00254D8B71|nr:recombinase family protein [Paracoccus sp. SSJ]MDK8874610.1 recombinase family protein [Paracoccus sp. SSJ]
MTRYVIYTRIGPDDLGRADASLAAQERDIRFFLFERDAEGNVVARRCDQAAGAGKVGGELIEALALCRDMGATLLVARIDRLPFDEAGFAAFLAESELDLKVAALPDAQKPDLLAHARLLREERRFDARRAARYLSRSQVKSWQCTVAHAEAESVEQIARIALPLRDGGATLRDIASALNRVGLTTARGTAWRANHVSRILHYMDSQRAGGGF